MSITFVAAGAASSGTAGISPAIPSGVVAGDLLILVAECSGGETVSTPSGWSAFDSTTNPAATSSLFIFSKTATGSDTAPSVADPGDHVIAQIMAWRGVDTGGSFGGFGGQEAAGSGSGTSVSVTGTGASTDAANSVVLLFVDNPTDTATSQGSAYANASLTNINERMDSNTTQGNGGGFSVASGDRATVGNYGTWTMTLASTASWAAIVASLVPIPIVSGVGSSDGTVTVSGVGSAVKSGDGASNGVVTAAGVGAATGSGVGSSVGAVTVLGVGSTASSIASGAGTSSATTIAAGVASSTASAVGAIAGQVTVTGVGASSDSATGASAAQVIALGVGASTAAGVGAASGAVIVDGRSAYFVEAVGNAAGLVSVLGVGAGGNEVIGGGGRTASHVFDHRRYDKPSIPPAQQKAARKTKARVLRELDTRGVLETNDAAEAELRAFVARSIAEYFVRIEAEKLALTNARLKAAGDRIIADAIAYQLMLEDDAEAALLLAA